VSLCANFESGDSRTALKAPWISLGVCCSSSDVHCYPENRLQGTVSHDQVSIFNRNNVVPSSRELHYKLTEITIKQLDFLEGKIENHRKTILM
jgi:hypothetical protein